MHRLVRKLELTIYFIALLSIVFLSYIFISGNQITFNLKNNSSNLIEKKSIPTLQTVSTTQNLRSSTVQNDQNPSQEVPTTENEKTSTNQINNDESRNEQVSSEISADKNNPQSLSTSSSQDVPMSYNVKADNSDNTPSSTDRKKNINHVVKSKKSATSLSKRKSHKSLKKPGKSHHPKISRRVVNHHHHKATHHKVVHHYRKASHRVVRYHKHTKHKHVSKSFYQRKHGVSYLKRRVRIFSKDYYWFALNRYMAKPNNVIYKVGTYKVHAGDSVRRIAHKFHLRTINIIAINKHLKDPDKLIAGQLLNIPNR